MPYVPQKVWEHMKDYNHVLQTQLVELQRQVNVWGERYAALANEVVGMKLLGAEKMPESPQYTPAPPAFPREVEEAIAERSDGDPAWRRIMERQARTLVGRGLNPVEIATWLRRDGADDDGN